MSDQQTPGDTVPRNLIPDAEAARLREQYRAALLDDVIPWWVEHSPDREHGGFYSLLERDGSPYGTDKYMWMNGRQVWMFSHLYNTVEQRGEWLELAGMGMGFMLANAFREDGKMHFRLGREGRSRSEVLSLYTEVFAAIAAAEYSVAAGEDALWGRALEIYDRLVPRLGRTTDTALLCYPIHQEFHTHAHDMCRLTVAWVFDALRPGGRFADDIARSVDSVLRRHWKPELGALLENVAMDGTPLLDLPEGRMVHPGHAIESAWMLMEVARARGDDALFGTAVDIALASLEHGWDQEYGGIRYVTNIDRTPTHSIEADTKLWWPHNEAQYALLLAWAQTGRGDVADWYRKVHEYAFGSFPDPEHGEWFGYLNRDGSRIWTAKANGWKGCFHLPRVLHRCHRLLAPSA